MQSCPTRFKFNANKLWRFWGTLRPKNIGKYFKSGAVTFFTKQTAIGTQSLPLHDILFILVAEGAVKALEVEFGVKNMIVRTPQTSIYLVKEEFKLNDLLRKDFKVLSEKGVTFAFM